MSRGRRNAAKLASAASIGLLLLIAPRLVGPYGLHLLTMSAIHALLTLGLNITAGYAGQMSMATGAFYGLGAYTSALVMMKARLPFIVAMLSGILLCGISAAVIGMPCLRLRGAYLSIVTLALNEVVRLVFVNWESLTRGPLGLVGIPSPGILRLGGLFAIDFSSRVAYYYLTITVLLLTVAVIYRIERSRIGRAFFAIRQDEIAAEMLGINAARYKILAFVLYASVCGVGGSLYAHFNRVASPEEFSLTLSITVMSMMLVGGIGSMVGAIAGSLFLTVLPEYLRALADFRMMMYGALTVAVLIVAPKGFVGLLDGLRRR